MSETLWRGDYVAGRWLRDTQPSETWLNEDPGDLDHPLGEFASRASSADEAVAAASQAFGPWSALSLAERTTFLQALAQQLDHRREQMAIAITREMGKPLWEARQEVGAVIAKIGVSLEIASRELVRSGPNDRTYYDWEPVGVAAVLGPFNFPLHLANGQIVPALIAGCPVIFKPSERTPYCAQIYTEAFEAAALPAGVFNLVQGDGRLGARLIEEPAIKAISFTGSLQVGLRILNATMRDPDKLVALEMGGKNATLVYADADLDHAVSQIAQSAFLTTGQRCSATSRVFVVNERVQELCDKLAARARVVRVGYGLDEGVFCGPVISHQAQTRFIEAQAGHESRERLCGGEALMLPRRGYYVSPAVHLAKPDATDPHQTEELFGPDVLIFAVDGPEAAIAGANSGAFGLCASVFTHDLQAFKEARRQLRCGIVNHNRGTIGASALLPFGGVAGSGNYRPAGATAIRNFIYPKATLVGRPGEEPVPPGFGGEL